MADTFETLGIDATLTAALGRMGIVKPTAIQTAAIPPALAGRDLAGRSATGTGKTIAFLLPLVAKIDATARENQALILAPTHELVIQIQRQLELLLADLPVTAVPLIGNANITRQIEKLKTKPHILVGSPGRVLELIQKRKINASTIKTIVLDEADRLLDDQNRDIIKGIIKTTRKERQILLFSATISEKTLSQMEGLLHDPALITVDGKPDVAATINHLYLVCEGREKIEVLRKLVHSSGLSQGLVFINNANTMEGVTAKLNHHGLAAAGLHSTYDQSERKKALDDFRRGKILLLVASDLAARGLDIRNVDFIYNLDVPEEPEIYLHRAGRTGRAGDPGYAVTLATAHEVPLIEKTEKVLGITIQPKIIREGRVLDAKGQAASPRRETPDKRAPRRR